MSLSSAFISGNVSRRLARTDPWHAMVDNNSSIELAIPKRDSSVEGEIEGDDDAPAEEDEEDVRDAEDFGREELMRKIEATKKRIEREQARAE